MTYQFNITVVEAIQLWKTIQCKHVIMCLYGLPANYTPTRVPAKTFEFAFILTIRKNSGSLTKGKRHVRYFEQTNNLYNKTIHAAQIRWPILSSAPRNDKSPANSRIRARFRADTYSSCFPRDWATLRARLSKPPSEFKRRSRPSFVSRKMGKAIFTVYARAIQKQGEALTCVIPRKKIVEQKAESQTP